MLLVCYLLVCLLTYSCASFHPVRRPGTRYKQMKIKHKELLPLTKDKFPKRSQERLKSRLLHPILYKCVIFI